MAEKTEEQESALKAVIFRATPSMEACEGRANVGKVKRNLAEEDNEFSTHDELHDIDEPSSFYVQEILLIKV